MIIITRAHTQKYHYYIFLLPKCIIFLDFYNKSYNYQNDLMEVGGENSIMEPIVGTFALISYVLFFLVVCPMCITFILYRLFGPPQVTEVKEAPPLILQGEDLADTPMIKTTNFAKLLEPWTRHND